MHCNYYSCFNEETWKQKRKDIKNMSTKDLVIYIKETNLSLYEWIAIFESENFTNSIIDKFGDDIPWNVLIMFTRVSEKYLEKYYDKLTDKYLLSITQDLSYNFVEAHKDELSLDILAKRNELTDSSKIKTLYVSLSDKKHKKIWEKNFNNNKVFSPLKSKFEYELDVNGLEREVTTPKPKTDYSKMSKTELKAILERRGVRVYYHDTIEVLVNKCKESEGK